MKRILACLLALALLPCAAMAEDMPTLGVCIYNEDTFVSSMLGFIREEAQGTAQLIVYNANGDRNRQNEQVEQLLRDDVDVLILNPVDRTAAVYLIRMAMQHQKPIVLINREPLREDLALYDLAYYVGIDPKQQGLLAGTLAADYFLTHPEADLNGDGRMQLVLLRGEPGHQDAELRSVYSLRALQDAGVHIDLLSEESAMWERTLAQEKMSVLLNEHTGRIECVVANNDDMALGAIDALKAAGYFADGRYMPVIGIDATTPAMQALEQGSLYATVRNDAEGQGRASVQLALLLAAGSPVDSSTFAYDMHNRVVYIDSSMVKAN